MAITLSKDFKHVSAQDEWGSLLNILGILENRKDKKNSDLASELTTANTAINNSTSLNHLNLILDSLETKESKYSEDTELILCKITMTKWINLPKCI